MPRASTTSDVFNAIAEPRRRQLIDLLARNGSRSVGELAASMGLAQPTVSKHLGVLREVGVVSVARIGKSRVYALEPRALKPLHDWVQRFESHWNGQLDRIKNRAERLAMTKKVRSSSHNHHHGE